MSPRSCRTLHAQALAKQPALKEAVELITNEGRAGVPFVRSTKIRHDKSNIRCTFIHVQRECYLREIARLSRQFRVVALLGARQVGKTTLARQFAKSKTLSFFDLESARDLARLTDPLLALEKVRGMVVLDEIQRRPDLFPVLRTLVDAPRGPRFLVLGSASRDLLQQSSETLAGRIAYVEVHPFSLAEVGEENRGRLWRRGGFPRSYLARSERESFEWRMEFIRTFVERDIPNLGASGTPSPKALARYWAMLAHVHGQLLNWSVLGRSMDVSDNTARRYCDLLEGALVVRQLPPFYGSIEKRQVKAPKLYFRDSGLLHCQLNLRTSEELERHPSLGASWEGFALEEVLRILAPEGRNAYFWRTHEGAELDLLIVRGSERHGFEFKRTSSPSITKSMHIARHDLKLDTLAVVHGGEHSFPLSPQVSAVALSDLVSYAEKLR